MERESFHITGLAGAKTLEGSIPVYGAKNAVLKTFAASFLFDGPVTIGNVPEIEDVHRMVEIIEDLGGTVSKKEDQYTIDTSNVTHGDVDDEIARRLRVSIVCSGPLLARFKKVTFPHPGGDLIGPRPINLFLDGFKRMGAEVTTDGDRYTLSAPNGLKGAEIFFLFITVTGTETLMLAATLAEGKTVLKNAAMEPEIVALAEFLNSCGAKISGAGTPTITIEGGNLLRANGTVCETIPDRIETGSFMILAALAGKDITITDCNPSHTEMIMRLMQDSGVEIETTESTIRIRSNGASYTPLQIRTHEYPGFATDLQSPMVVYLTQAEGESTVFETIFGGRLNYTQDLIAMGANITLWNPHQISVKGRTPLVGRELESPDIRAGLAFLIAAAIAEGNSIVHNIYHIDRGYAGVEKRLQKLGLSIERTAICP
jgi:UDP-N-acetylglucosamine 1-carboxyvinyltransferase